MTTPRVATSVACFVLIATTIASKLLHSQNWLSTEAVDSAVAELTSLPRQFGAWVTEREDQIAAEDLQVLQCAGHQSRMYKNTLTGDRIQMVVLVGAAGPLIAHTPEICMASRDFVQIGKSQQVSFEASPGQPVSFQETQFRARTLEARTTSIYHAWSRDSKKWDAPAQPRIELGNAPFLYKLQIASANQSLLSDAAAPKEFLSQLLVSWSDAQRQAASEKRLPD